MSTRTAVTVSIWALSLAGVGLGAQAPTRGGTFGAVILLGGGLTTQYQGHADIIEGTGTNQTMTYRGNVSISLPDAHFVLLADEAVLDPSPTTTSSGKPIMGEEFRLQGNVRLKLVRP